jgi:hypothetical protein
MPSTVPLTASPSKANRLVQVHCSVSWQQLDQEDINAWTTGNQYVGVANNNHLPDRYYVLNQTQEEISRLRYSRWPYLELLGKLDEELTRFLPYEVLSASLAHPNRSEGRTFCYQCLVLCTSKPVSGGENW